MASKGSGFTFASDNIAIVMFVVLDTVLLVVATCFHFIAGLVRPRRPAANPRFRNTPNNQQRLRDAIDIAWARNNLSRPLL